MRKFLKIKSKFFVQSTNKKYCLIDNHYKSIFKSVRNACTSYRVKRDIFISCHSNQLEKCYTDFLIVLRVKSKRNR